MPSKVWAKPRDIQYHSAVLNLGTEDTDFVEEELELYSDGPMTMGLVVED